MSGRRLYIGEILLLFNILTIFTVQIKKERALWQRLYGMDYQCVKSAPGCATCQWAARSLECFSPLCRLGRQKAVMCLSKQCNSQYLFRQTMMIPWIPWLQDLLLFQKLLFSRNNSWGVPHFGPWFLSLTKHADTLLFIVLLLIFWFVLVFYRLDRDV